MTDRPMTDPQPAAPVAARPAPPPPPLASPTAHRPRVDHGVDPPEVFAGVFLVIMIFLAVVFAGVAVWLFVAYFPR